MNQSINRYYVSWDFLCIALSLASALCAYANRMDTLLSTTKPAQAQDYASVSKDLATYFTDYYAVHDDANTRLIKALDIFLGRPYQYDSVGDGPDGDFDNRPTVATHGFDCMSLTNTVLAMVVSEDISSFHQHYRRIRYHSLPAGYFNRHHFISFQWHPHNQKQGYIHDLTRSIKLNSEPLARTLETAIDYPSWLVFQKKMLSKNHALTTQQDRIWQQELRTSSSHNAKLDYIKFNDFLASPTATSSILAQIPGGSIIYLVTPHWDLRAVIGTELDIAHLGFIVIRDGVHFITHASLKGVVSLPLVDYIRYLQDNNKRFAGFSIEKILIPGKRNQE